MAAVDFPAYGQLDLSSYQEAPASALERTEMDAGPPKQPLTRHRVLESRSVTYLFTGAEYASFKDWVQTTLNRGRDWFNWVEPVDGATIEVRIVGGVYQAKPGGLGELTWAVSFHIESWS